MVDEPERLQGVGQLGVDETAFLAANARHSATLATGVVDLSGPVARLLDIVPGRSAKALSGWVSGRDQGWRDRVEVAALDPFCRYASALATSLPDAVRVLDAFHGLGFAAVDDVRRRVQQDSLGQRGRRDDPLFNIRRLLRRRADRLTDRGWVRILAALAAGDVDQQIG